MFSALERFSEWPGAHLPAPASTNARKPLRPEGLDERRTRLRPYHALLMVWSVDLMSAAAASVVARIAVLGGGRAWHADDVMIVLAAGFLAWAALAERQVTQADSTMSLRLHPSRLLSGWLNAFGLLMLLLLAGELIGAAWPAARFLPNLSRDGTAAWMLCLFASGLAFLVAGRLVLVSLLSRFAPADLDRHGRTAMRAVVVGEGLHAARVCADLQELPAPIRVMGVVDAGGTLLPVTRDKALNQDEADFRIHAATAQSLVDLLRRGPIDTVVVAMPRGAETQVRAVLDALSALPLDIWLAPDFAGETDPALPPLVGAMPLLRLRGRPLSTFELALKKLEDMLAASVLLVLTAPVMALIALAILLESGGPVMFTQQRRGYNERLIGVLKFRTMYAEHTDAHATRQTVRGDERVTRVGRLLRRFSLDELPQLINVLRGEMSVVGPRPHALQTKAAGVLFDEVVANYGARHRVKPGITGWAQIHGWRGETDTVEKIVKRVEFDIDYIENWSLRRDLAIMFMTAFRILADREAF